MSENISKNSNNNIEVSRMKWNGLIKTEIDITSSKVMNIYDIVKDIVVQLMVSGGKWEGNIHKHVMMLVKELIEFTESYKFLAGKDKKMLAMLLLKEIFSKVNAYFNHESTLQTNMAFLAPWQPSWKCHQHDSRLACIRINRFPILGWNCGRNRRFYFHGILHSRWSIS